MSYRLAADALVWLHLGFILFVLFGGLLPLRWPRLAWLHLPAVAWGCAVEFLGLPCPLTPPGRRGRRLQRRLRRALPVAADLSRRPDPDGAMDPWRHRSAGQPDRLPVSVASPR